MTSLANSTHMGTLSAEGIKSVKKCYYCYWRKTCVVQRDKSGGEEGEETFIISFVRDEGNESIPGNAKRVGKKYLEN